MKKGRTAKCPRRVALPNCSLPAPPRVTSPHHGGAKLPHPWLGRSCALGEWGARGAVLSSDSISRRRCNSRALRSTRRGPMSQAPSLPSPHSHLSSRSISRFSRFSHPPFARYSAGPAKPTSRISFRLSCLFVSPDSLSLPTRTPTPSPFLFFSSLFSLSLPVSLPSSPCHYHIIMIAPHYHQHDCQELLQGREKNAFFVPSSFLRHFSSSLSPSLSRYIYSASSRLSSVFRLCLSSFATSRVTNSAYAAALATLIWMFLCFSRSARAIRHRRSRISG